MSRIGYRICTGYHAGGQWVVQSLTDRTSNQPAVVGQILGGRHYVGTSRDFVLEHYTGMVDLQPGEHELLLTLRCEPDPLMDERWECQSPTEALVTDPIVLEIEVIHQNER